MFSINSNVLSWEKRGIRASKVFSERETAHNLRVVLTARIKRINREQFKAQGRGQTGKWKPLSQEYALRKAKTHPGKKILRKSDRLFRAATSDAGSSNRTAISSSGFTYIYNIHVPWARFHQDGDGVPRRRIFDPNTQQQRGMTAAIARTIVDGIFSRAFFDNRRRSGISLVIKNRGFDSVSV